MAEKGKAVEKEKKIQKSSFYEVDNDKVKRKNLFCPKCGAGVFMAAHKDRNTCGKCGFTQWKNK
ncbi:MAG: 30S ribosomal protein S27ae [Candidatus Diapherotrites archaeon]|uniref:Small ribosomal subunit protein eS31 n=1 Tax=Candidatus Iainarchaeum sp. TaxID=3101447 RepID=A0A8T4L469_9ARCH|nr:30S ribosomal protein S27ae [Candidatus Diapherotrites archaeon]